MPAPRALAFLGVADARRPEFWSMNPETIHKEIRKAVTATMRKGAVTLQHSALVPGQYVVYLHEVDFQASADLKEHLFDEVRQDLDRALHRLNRQRKGLLGFLRSGRSGRPFYARDTSSWVLAMEEAGPRGRYVPMGDVRVESVLQTVGEHAGDLVVREQTIVTLCAGGRLSSDVEERVLPFPEPPPRPDPPDPVEREASSVALEPGTTARRYEPVDAETARDAVRELKATIVQALAEAGVQVAPADGGENGTPGGARTGPAVDGRRPYR